MSHLEKNARVSVLLAAFFLFFTSIAAQTLPLTSYTTANGLASDYVTQIVRDSRGFLWFCTGEGLSRFDGYEFKNYTQADGLPHRSVNDLVELRDGRFLAATNDGLAVFDPKGVSKRHSTENSLPMFRGFRPPDTGSDRKAASVNDLHIARDGRTWAGTMDGLYEIVVSGEDVEFRRIEHPLWSREKMLLEFVGLAEDGEGLLWLAMSAGTFLYDPKNGTLSEIHRHPAFKGIIADRQGNIWTGSNAGGTVLSRYAKEAGKVEPVRTGIFTGKDGLVEKSWINAHLETSDGRILIGQAAGVSEYLPQASENEPKFRMLLPGADVVSLAEDRVGNIWIGTSSRGALKLARRGFEFFGEKDGIPSESIISVMPGEGDEIFAGSGKFEMLRFDGEKFGVVRPMGMKARSWGWNQTELRSKVDGNWWIATADGVLRYPRISSFEQLAVVKPLRNYADGDGLYSAEVFRMYEDSRGNIWIYTFGKAGDTQAYVHLWERNSDTVRRFSSEDGLPAGNNVTAFTEDRAGNIWLGGYYGGVTRYRDGKFHSYSVEGGFPRGFINALLTDSRGRVWAATGNSGVVRIDDPAGEEPGFVSISTSNGLSSDQATCVTEDNFGRIYVGTGRGINRLEPETGRIKAYTQADGLPFSAVRVCGSDANGNLWFVQNNVIGRLRPEPDQTGLPPAVFVGDLRVNGETVRKLSELGETSVGSLDLASDQRQIQIGYFALGFGSGERLLYQYKLEGTGEEWSEPSAQRSVNLNLAPGGYRFLVRAINSDGVASDAPAVVAFSIARPVWQRWWFLLIVAMVLSGVIYFIYRYRLRRLLELERVRTRIATDLHDDIGSSLSQIAILSEVVRQKSGPNGASEPLAMIADTSREMVDSMSDIVWAINPQKDHLTDLAHRMRRFASDLLDATDISYRFNLPDGNIDVPLGADVRREVYLIFKECLNNAVKHSRATEISIVISVRNNELGIEVRDNGVGFDVESKLNGDHDGLGGNGFNNMKKRGEKLGGGFDLDSSPGNGTNLKLTIPLRRSGWFDKARTA